MQIDSPYIRELNVAIATARLAGAAIRVLYERSAAAQYTKEDGSPVTDADLASDRIIRERLAFEFPADAILTEEEADDPARLSARRVWIADPTDGTQQFVERTGEFDVLIALVEDGRPVVGVLLQPTSGAYLAASHEGGALVGRGDESDPLDFAPVSSERPPRLLTSTWLNLPAALPALSAAARRLGSAEPEINPLGIVVRQFLPPENRFDSMIGLPTLSGQTMAWEWDFAAADIVVHEAGGRFTDCWGNRFRYNKPEPRNIGGVLLSVDPVTHERVLEAIRPELPAQ